MSEAQVRAPYDWQEHDSKMAAIRAKHPTASTRLVNCCVCSGYDTLEELAKLPDHEIMRRPNFGKVSLAELRQLTGTTRNDPALEALHAAIRMAMPCGCLDNRPHVDSIMAALSARGWQLVKHT